LFIERGFSNPDFQPYEYLKSKNLSPQGTSKLISHLEAILKEISLAYRRKDEYLEESYGNYKRKNLKQYMDFVESLIIHAITWRDQSKLISKANKVESVRKKKTVVPEKVVRSVKYQKDDSEYNLVSVNPVKILGANQLWTYNTIYRQLSVYYAKDDSGLWIKGCSILNYHEENSVQKKLRNPQPILKDVLEQGKVGLRSVMINLKTKGPGDNII
jgi:hypothetical protein